MSNTNRAHDGNSGANEGRQSLRETSVIDVIVPEGQHGAVGSSRPRRSSIVSGGSVDFTGMNSQEPEDYGHPATSSNVAPDFPTVAVSSVASPGIAAFLAASLVISMMAVRSAPNADPTRPAFLYGIVARPDNPSEWNQVVLPRIQNLIFIISNTADLHWSTAMLSASSLPHLFDHITTVIFNQMYWFSGTSPDRPNNPYFMFASGLRWLRQLSFTLHTAGLTTSAFGERVMIELERTDPERAKERRVKSLRDVVVQYDLAKLLALDKLQRIRIEYIDCEMTAYFTRGGQPVDVLRELQNFLITGFEQRNREVHVELVEVQR